VHCGPRLTTKAQTLTANAPYDFNPKSKIQNPKPPHRPVHCGPRLTTKALTLTANAPYDFNPKSKIQNHPTLHLHLPISPILPTPHSPQPPPNR